MAKTPAQRAKKHGDRATPGAASAEPVGIVSATGATRKSKSNANLIIIAGVAASAFLFWYFHLLTLNQMTQLSQGLAMPDSMVFGFDGSYVEQLRSVLDSAALGQLQFVHKTAGTLFPLIFAFTWLILIGLWTRKGALRWALWVPPLAFAVVQLSANFVIDAMLSNSRLDSGQITWASSLVIASWTLLALSLLGALVALLTRGPARSKAESSS